MHSELLWATAGNPRDSEDYRKSDWIRLNIVVTEDGDMSNWAISNKRWN